MKELIQKLNAFHSEALRLEALQRYSEPSERPLFERYVAGEPVPSGRNEWPELVRGKKYGRRFERVRLVTEPLSTYTRFEIEWLYPPNHAAGEEILITTVDRAYSGPDFWLFDQETIVRMHYDKDGALVETELSADRAEVDAALADYHRYRKDAVPLTRYLKGIRNGQE